MYARSQYNGVPVWRRGMMENEIKTILLGIIDPAGDVSDSTDLGPELHCCKCDKSSCTGDIKQGNHYGLVLYAEKHICILWKSLTQILLVKYEASQPSELDDRQAQNSVQVFWLRASLLKLFLKIPWGGLDFKVKIQVKLQSLLLLSNITWSKGSVRLKSAPRRFFRSTITNCEGVKYLLLGWIHLASRTRASHDCTCIVQEVTGEIQVL
ncbi:hypothetical protein IW261DRAFT_1592155 [Armillaria novae-zelandiae]|uniref:Uncharacterized protein n=1 Tax=Armillaria novae-zelandiae TaxID=153914 RepID=A0AA39PEK6_9AGAR|nr:hypothetical protein IW261DRAFT_1592155 [Armillaria novae-zelandiae]